MKKLVVIVVLLIAVAAGLPFINGVLLERVLKKAVEDANAMQADNPFGSSFEIVNYKRDYSTTDYEQMKKEMAQMSLKMAAAYEKLLKKGLEIQVSDVHVILPWGEIKGAVTLRLLQDMTIAQFLPFMNQPQDLFDALYVQTDISLPVELVGEKPELRQSPFNVFC